MSKHRTHTVAVSLANCVSILPTKLRLLVTSCIVIIYDLSLHTIYGVTDDFIKHLNLHKGEIIRCFDTCGSICALFSHFELSSYR